MSDIILHSLDEFIALMKQKGIAKLSFAETNEKRAVQVDASTLAVQHVARVEILAYRKALIYKCVLENTDLEAAHQRLIDDGFEVVRRSRNIV